MPSRMRHSKFILPVVYDFIRGLFFHVSICYKLGLKLFRSLTEGTYLWVIMLGRLIIFTVVLLPGWIGMVKYWIFSPKIIRNVEYGLGARKRNLLDIYLPADSASGSSEPVPVVVFVTGGAWIIGYKLWCALIGRGLSSMGVLTIVPDYRNFPQGDVQDMVSDIVAAVRWTHKNARQYGGNPEKMVLAGQSAGAHICMCALVDALRKKVDDRKNNINFRTSDPALKPLDDIKSYQAKKSLNNKKSILHLDSPVQGYFRDRKRVDSLSPKGNSYTKEFESEGGGMDVSDVDTEAEDNNDYEDEDDDDCATWKSTSPNRDQPLNSTIPLSPDGKDRDNDRDISSPTRTAAERSIFSRFESPKKVKEIQVFVGSALRSIGGDVKGAVVSVCRGIKENVDVAAAHLHEIELDLRTPNIADASMDSDVLKLSEIKLFVGVSGPYNLLALSAHMQSRGLDHSILKWICRGDVEKYSPALQLDAVMAQTLSLISPRTESQTTKQHQTEKKIVTGKSTIYESSTPTGKYGFFVTKNCKSDTSVMSAAGGKRMVVSTDPDQLNASCKSSISGGGTDCDLNEEEEEEINRMTLRGLHFPPVALFHGAKDFSVPSSVSVEMAATLCRWGGEVFLRMYEGWAHTDAILEAPLTGDNALCEDIIAQIRRTFPITPVSTTSSSSSRASFDASGNILSSTSTSNSQTHSQPTRKRSRTNSIPQPFMNLTPSASTEDLLSSDFIDTMSGRIPVNENESGSGSGSVLRGMVRENGTALVGNRSEVWARAVCSRCSLRCSVSNSDHAQNAQNGHSGCHDVISDLLERNGRFDGGCDKDPSSILDDSEQNNHSLFIAKYESHVSHAVAVPVAVPAPVLPTNGNGRNVLAGTDHRCYGTVLLPTQGEEKRCICHGTHTHTNPNEEVLANALNFNNNKRKKGDTGVQSSDDFADCRVPLLLVGVARWVNPF